MVSCGGYRFGWLVFNSKELNDLYEICNVMASSIYSCPSLVFQHVAITALEYPVEIIKYLVFQREVFTDLKRKIITELENTDLVISESNAAWYMLINFDAYRDKMLKLGIKNSGDLSKYLINKLKIIMVSGDNFGIDENLVLRYSYIDLKDVNLEDFSYNFENISLLIVILKDWLHKLV